MIYPFIANLSMLKPVRVLVKQCQESMATSDSKVCGMVFQSGLP